MNNISDRFANARKAQKKVSVKNQTDTLKAFLDIVGKNAAEIPIGKGVALPIPANTDAKKFLASVRGRATAVTREGEPLVGRDYQTMLDLTTNPEKPEVLVQRLDDRKTPLGRKTGGRPAGSLNKNKADAGSEGENETPETNANNDNKETEKPVPEIKTTVVRDLTGKGKNKAA